MKAIRRPSASDGSGCVCIEMRLSRRDRVSKVREPRVYAGVRGHQGITDIARRPLVWVLGCRRWIKGEKRLDDRYRVRQRMYGGRPQSLPGRPNSAPARKPEPAGKSGNRSDERPTTKDERAHMLMFQARWSFVVGRSSDITQTRAGPLRVRPRSRCRNGSPA
jgi:hypothetical protein